LVVMNQILSMDRMFKVLRSKEGLTYAPWGNYGADYDHPGVFSCGTQTKSQSTVYAVRLMLNEVKRMATEPVTDEELALAKDSYLNSFVFNFDSKSKIVTRMMTYAYYNYPLDFIDKLREGVEKVTKEDVLRAAKSHLQPDKLQILVVGNKDEFGEPLPALGDVNVIDITIPSPPSEASPETTDESLSRGRELFDKAAEAIGGADVLMNIRNTWIKLDLLQSTEAGDMQMSGEATIVYPDHIYQSISTPMGEIKMVVAGENGWMVSPQGRMPMQESTRKIIQDNISRDPVNFFAKPDELQIQFIGEKPFNGATALDLLVTRKNGSFHLYLDGKTYLPAGVSYQSTGPQGPISVEEAWSDYREIDGMSIPFKTTASANGKKMSDVTVKEVKHNIEVDSKLFEEE
ncbi:MAG: insulinase family protein, partial [Bacteroidetes bacterium]|nr:insulinase family protein [Bacteroidota bacterium]